MPLDTSGRSYWSRWLTAGGGVDGELSCQSCYCAGRRRKLQRREKCLKEKRERVAVVA
jgi:hypothetical protein